MAELVDLTGKRFGRLVVVRKGNRRSNATWWWCRCDCGTEKEVRAQPLTRGDNKSCGCLRVEEGRRRTAPGGEMDNRSHGMYQSPEYHAWHGMLDRCRNTNSKSFPDYGGRGVVVCERWTSFENFFSDMGKRPSASHSLERENNERGYEPENCKWATRKEQQRNRRSNRLLTFNSETRCLAEWAERSGLTWQCLYGRLHSGWTLERAITTPMRSAVRP